MEQIALRLQWTIVFLHLTSIEDWYGERLRCVSSEYATGVQFGMKIEKMTRTRLET